MSLRVHDRFGPYELLAALGERGLGEVWKARDSTNGRLVALRILPGPSVHADRFARLERDVRTLTTLNHPNIAKIYGLLEAGPVRALAFEWVEGPSLAQLIAARGAIPIDETIRTIVQVANALGAAHSRAVVHGDVKPSNIKLCADGTVRVLDFGVAEVFEPEGLARPSDTLPAASARLRGVITGTAAYMSPEQVQGSAADSQADVWAFGCVLYETLTGKPAFAADDLVETMALVTGSEPEWTLLSPAIPMSIVGVLRRCLDKDVTARFQRMTDVLAPIRETTGEQGAVEAFLRQSALDQLSDTHAEPDWTDDVWPEIAKELPGLKRWARTGLPPGLDVDVDDLVQDTVIDTARRLKEFSPRHAGALQAYLRQVVLNRIRDVVRRRRRQEGEELDPDDRDSADADAIARYRKALEQLSERERNLIISRVEEQFDYDQIASRFSFPSVTAARIAVKRALRRLAEFLTGKKRD